MSIILYSGNPLFFIQKRIGKNRKKFTVLKFRTMKINSYDLEKKGIPQDKLITLEGRILRKLHLDELPQLFNILIGDMTFVGPRPLMWDDYLMHIKVDNDYTKVFRQRPGLTGLNSVMTYISVKKRRAIMKILGLKHISRKSKHSKKSIQYHVKKIEREICYYDQRSFILDLRIISWSFIMLYEQFVQILKNRLPILKTKKYQDSVPFSAFSDNSLIQTKKAQKHIYKK
jgi:lipopolysaccharide/colanic/teichoic acid biosynthesis glycosyltransferase